VRSASQPDRPRLRDVLWLGVAVAGGVMCITLLSLGMRSVMDIGGACADGGPYVSARPCPNGTAPAMFLGSFGLFGFGALGMVFGARVGSPWGAFPLFGWSLLFGVLGWNFLQYGWLNPPEGQGVELGFLVPGIMFEVMAIVPLLFMASALWALRGYRRPAGAPSVEGSSAPPRVPAAYRRERTEAVSPSFAAMEARQATAAAGSSVARDPARRAALSGIDAAMAAALAPTPGAAGATAAGAADATATPDFQEGTQSLLDRLERLGDMRARGLLAADEYETAKDAVLRELEARE
jgi:hypothetical protein